MIVAGIGCRRGTTAADIVAVIRLALAQTRDRRVGALATSVAKAQEPGLAAAAAELGLPLLVLPDAALQSVVGRVVTRSARVERIAGVPSVAETAALAGAGPQGRLIVPRVALAGATCALAEGEAP